MNSQVHRILMLAGSILSGLGGITGGADLIDPQVGAWIAFGGAAAILVANTWRVYFPDSKEST